MLKQKHHPSHLTRFIFVFFRYFLFYFLTFSYRWKMGKEKSNVNENYCFEVPENEFVEVRTIIEKWQDQGFSLRVIKKVPGK